jgi:hypothetical protein
MLIHIAVDVILGRHEWRCFGLFVSVANIVLRTEALKRSFTSLLLRCCTGHQVFGVKDDVLGLLGWFSSPSWHIYMGHFAVLVAPPVPAVCSSFSVFVRWSCIDCPQPRDETRKWGWSGCLESVKRLNPFLSYPFSTTVPAFQAAGKSVFLRFFYDFPPFQKQGLIFWLHTIHASKNGQR